MTVYVMLLCRLPFWQRHIVFVVSRKTWYRLKYVFYGSYVLLSGRPLCTLYTLFEKNVRYVLQRILDIHYVLSFFPFLRLMFLIFSWFVLLIFVHICAFQFYIPKNGLSLAG